MKKYFLFVFVYLCTAFSLLNAQEKNDSVAIAEQKKFIFFDVLTSQKQGEGQVRVYQDPRLVTAMAEHVNRNKIKNGQDFILINGYRVQVYSSNAPKTAKNEAFMLEAEIKEKFPDVNVHITYSSPFWRVRVGDCKTYQEATTLLNLLKNKFPTIKDTFYIIKEDVQIPI